MATVSGGMPQAAAAVAAAAAAGVQQTRLVEGFYRFQQREQRRTGGWRPETGRVRGRSGGFGRAVWGDGGVGGE
jgi:hypothetical protein